MPLAVFWDMDGTIVDTEPLWIAAEQRMVEDFGGLWTPEDGLRLVGKGLEESAEILRAAGVRWDVDDIVQSLTNEVTDALHTRGAEFRPGAVELLHSLHDAGIPMGLVTMSLRRMADAVMDMIGFDAFDVIVTGDTAHRPKPYPDPYLQAAQQSGIDVRHTVVLEDSPGGLRSGLASGAVTVGIPHLVKLDGLGADALWPTLAGRTAEDITTLYAQHRVTVAAKTPGRSHR